LGFLLTNPITNVLLFELVCEIMIFDKNFKNKHHTKCIFDALINIMKITLFYVGLLFFSFTVYSQSKKITIDWEGTPSGQSVDFSVEKNFQEKQAELLASMNLAFNEDEAIYREQWQDNGFANKNSLRISNIRYGTPSLEELQKININEIPTSLDSRIISTKARDIIYTRIQMNPIIKDKEIIQKVLSFDVSYSYSRQASNASRRPITNSVLATGAWYKFKINETGVYRITKSFLSDLGMNTNSLDPRKLKIYGHGGKPLPMLVGANAEFDLPENAIQAVGEDDGSFDSNDYILFYGIGTLGFDAQSDPLYNTHINPYADEAFYYVTADGGNGLRVQTMTEPVGAPNVVITAFDDYQYHEEDDYSPVKVGRRWFGNRFDIESEQQFEFAFPNIVSGEEMDVTLQLAAVSESTTSMAVSVNGTSIDPVLFTAGGGGGALMDFDSITEYIPAPQDSQGIVTVDMVYSNAGNPSSIAYLDYIRIRARRNLVGTGSQIAFRYNDAQITSGVGQYNLADMASYNQVWDVTDRGAITSKSNENGESSIQFKALMGETREYVAVHESDYYAPIKLGQSRVVNQNLKGTIFNTASGSFEDVDYIIICPSFLIQPALRLANHHKTQNGLRVKVVTLDKIYNEFSSGKQDIAAIRNFLKYVYDNASSSEERLKYVGILGDTSLDYKDRLQGNNNIVPSFHTLASNSTTSSFLSDDFFGCYDEGEGSMVASDLLDIAVGRILADNVSDANAMVDKLVNYESKNSYGNWRNNFLLISDDVDVAWEYEFLEVTLDQIGDDIAAEKPFINVKKIHSDAYQQEASAGGDRYPEVNKAISNTIEIGALIVTYFGHGGEDGLAKEFIYTKTDAQNLQNANKNPLIVTVTCEYTRFDNPLRITAGELVYTNKVGGAIGLITTTRSITVSLGVQYNTVLAPILFGYGTSDYPAPAEALRRTKNTLTNPLKRVVFFIGDPAMKLAFPQPSVKLTTLNGEPIGVVSDTLKALSKVRMGGEVVDQFGNLQADYNGILEAKVFDKYVQRQTLGNDGIIIDGELAIMDFVTLGEGLFNGQATVTNGTFDFDFVVPRDIQIPVGMARVSLYSQRDNVLEDNEGFNLAIKVGGLNEDALVDDIGPTINLFMNDESFASGGYTNDSPILLAKLEDENGINTASGIGHDMIAILDGDEANPIVLNEYYQADVDDYMRGTTTYRLRDLEEGLHVLTVKAWDVYNNSSTADIQFIVTGGNTLKISRVLNYPNPFVDYTEFWFNHNRPFEPLEVQVQVFTITGKVVWTKNDIDTTDGFLSRKITWDGRDDFGDKIGKGVYVYKITVKSTLTNKQVEKFEKLVIL
jgi:hypothetical protein